MLRICEYNSSVIIGFEILVRFSGSEIVSSMSFWQLKNALGNNCLILLNEINKSKQQPTEKSKTNFQDTGLLRSAEFAWRWSFVPSDRAVIRLNYTARSHHSAFKGGIIDPWPRDNSNLKQFPWTPANINSSYFVEGFNLIAPEQHPRITIKSHQGMQSQPVACTQPYLLRGVGIGYRQDHPPIPEISCGEIMINHQKPKP